MILWEDLNAMNKWLPGKEVSWNLEWEYLSWSCRSLYVYTFSIIPDVGSIMRTYHITNAKYIHNAAPKFNLIPVSNITPSLDFYSICKMKTYRRLKVMLRLHSQKWEFELFPALLVPQTLHRWVGPQICNVTN